MNYNIAVPNNNFYEKLYANKDFIKEKQLRIHKLNDQEALNLLMDSRIDAALLSPLAYGSAVDKCDLRIIPSKLCMAESYTDTISIYFKQNLKTINTVTYNENNNFVTQISQILFKEKFEIFPEMIFESKNHDNFETDLLVTWEQNESDKSKMNLTEEWFDNFFFPLPLKLWVCKAEDSPNDLIQITNNLFKADQIIDEFYLEHPFNEDFYTQEGKIYWEWESEFKNVLDNTIQIMYFHQLFPELPEIKFYEGT